MKSTATLCFAVIVIWLLCDARAWPLDRSVSAIRGDVSRSLLGDGTNVVIGIVDSGIEDAHPALTGNDSLGNARLVAEANFVPTEPSNAGDDVFGHGTWVASAALSSDADFTGLAPDARYINARVLDSGNGFASGSWVQDGVGFAIENDADILNLSLNFFSPISSGTSQLDRMVDWAVENRGVHVAICVGNIGGGSGTSEVRGPGSAFNGVTVGRTDASFNRVHNDSATAFTEDGRMKPDVVAPGTSLTLANHDFGSRGQPLFDRGLSGCSYATPHVAGMMAQQIEAGTSRGMNTSPLVIKATMMNSADHDVLDQQGTAWEPTHASMVGNVFTSRQPLDAHMGTGQIDGLQLSQQYLAGEQDAGIVADVGWDLGAIGHGETLDYHIADPLLVGTTLTTTLTWLRHINRVDGGAPGVDAADFFSLASRADDLDLQVLRDGMLIAESVSSIDNTEHLQVKIDQLATYTIRVRGSRVVGDPSEQFGLAWFSTAIPEPTTAMLAMLQLMVGCLLCRRRQ